MFPLSPDYYKEPFPIQLNWPGAATTPFDGCSLGLLVRISAEFWKPSRELFHAPEQRERFLKIRDSLVFFRALKSFSNAKIDQAWPNQIQLRSQRFVL